ncbi:hypothetical protein [uncultured Psychroserpens sp.]|uniref:hypothetical protein n=1 Tax=uncultured Psychroserpens sp. TaxID=255436 RepID=UPI0026102381|nr:hypothetical protein [uncultured Psychroserpens sp.]
MKKSLFFMVLLTVVSFNAIAQDTARQNLTSPGMVYAFDMNDNSIIGTPYIIDKFMPGKISADKEGKLYSLRYNAFNDVIELKKNENEVEALNRDLVNVTITFSNSNKSYRAYNYIDAKTKKGKRGYFVIASDVSHKKPLLIKERVVFIEKQKAKSGYAKTKPAQYKRKSDQYYTLNESGIAIELSTKKKDLANSFPEHSKAILDYIKSNKIKTSKQEDLVKLMDYINSL